MPEFPKGTVTFLFTDVEGSTRRWEQDSPAMLDAIQRHFCLLDEAIAAHNGVRFKTIGDAIQAAFATAPDALKAAVGAQRALVNEDWGSAGPIQVRMALHTGAAEPRENDYLAPALNRLARLLATTSGGQMVMTEATRNLVRDHLPPDIQLHDLGPHRLRDLRETEHVYQVNADGLPTTFPALRSLDRPLHNLPAQVTPFVGREREMSEVKRRLDDPNIRLLTLTGPGGTGKTRLALQVGAELLGAYPDGVWFVPLASVTMPGRVASAIAEALGIRESPGEPIVESLRAFLPTRRLLLILDNFEHVVESAPLVAELLADAPELNVLATSRTPLRISGEHEIPVQPLHLPGGDEVGLDKALAAEAIQLFIARARAVRGDFVLTEQNVGTIVAICRRLDGLPLAIELAAARMRLLSPETILSRLDSRLALLTGGGRDRPERQQTLRAAIAWSHELLDTTERALFRRLAVFSGGWTLAAAEIIVNSIPEPSIDAIDCLGALQDNSLIRLADGEAADADADPRFAMLQTIREFALEQLSASGEAETIADAHAAYFLALTEDTESHLLGASAATWLDRLEADHDNVRAAMSWLRKHEKVAQAVTMAGSLWRFWWLRGHIDEGRTELEAALTLPPGDDEDARRARAAALDGAGVLAETQGQYEQAQALHEQALALSRESDDRAGIARAQENLGVLALDRLEVDEAESLLAQSLTLARESGDEHLIASALNELGRVAHEKREYERADALYRESLALRRRDGNPSDVARVLNNLGALALNMEEFAQATTLFEESLDLYREIGDPWGAAGALNGLAQATRSQGQAVEAIGLFARSRALFDETGDSRNSALALLGLANAEKLADSLDDSAAHYREAIDAFRAVDDALSVADGLAGLAGVLAREGRLDTAAQVLSAATASLSEDESRALVETDAMRTDLEAIREALGEERFAAAWSAGETMSLDAAIAEATGAVTVGR